MEKKPFAPFSRLALAGILAGGLSVAGCAKDTTTAPQAKAITSAKTLAAFEGECAKLGGQLVAHDCKGHNECKGYSYQEGMAVGAHDCKGLSGCAGKSCIEG